MCTEFGGGKKCGETCCPTTHVSNKGTHIPVMSFWEIGISHGAEMCCALKIVKIDVWHYS